MPIANDRRLFRREFLARAGINVGAIALASLLGREPSASAAAGQSGVGPLDPKPPHFPPRADRVIFLNMAGAPPQLDMFDYKPKLKELADTRVPASITQGERFAFIEEDAKILPPLYEFKKYGQAGMWMSSVTGPMPEIADDICMIHGVHTDQFNHVPAALKMFCGFPRAGRPSMGSWVTYGLGSACEDLPGFLVLNSGRGSRCGSACHGAGFLPSVYQGVTLRSAGEPVLYLENPAGVSRGLRRESLDVLRLLNESEFDELGDPETRTRIEQYEMAFRMQTSVPELADLSQEREETLALYGAEPGRQSFANNCLLARRLVESGVRFIQLNHGEWDLHGGPTTNIPTHCPLLCRQTMQPTVALIQDLGRRGLLSRTLVIWGAEFGRTPMLQGKKGPEVGRDHHRTFTIWMAGGGMKAGFLYGASDELGYRPEGETMSVYDVQATILHLLGLDHERLTFKFQGRPFRLTDVHGAVNEQILA